jgi:hypothetical protein
MSGSDNSRERPGDAERYRVLLEIGRELAATLSQNELYEAIYRETARAVEASGFYIALHDQSRDLARVVFYADKRDGQKVDVSYRGSDSEVIRSQQAMLVNDDLGDRTLFVWGDEGKVAVAALAAPLIHHGKVLGVISPQSY